MSLLSLILSFMALFVISTLLFVPIDEETRHLLIGLDFIICSIFLIQLTMDLIRAANKHQYLKTHWVDFAASLPMIEPLRYARVFHIFRVILLIRSGRVVLQQLSRNRKETTLASILLLLVVLLTVGSMTILSVESQAPEGNIHSWIDAIWWAFVTISTVGYGDHYPVTDVGKLVASIVIICGVGLFGMISGLITSIITHSAEDQLNDDMMMKTIIKQQQEILKRLEAIENTHKKSDAD